MIDDTIKEEFVDKLIKARQLMEECKTLTKDKGLKNYPGIEHSIGTIQSHLDSLRMLSPHLLS